MAGLAGGERGEGSPLWGGGNFGVLFTQEVDFSVFFFLYLFFLVWLKCVLWIGCVLCGETRVLPEQLGQEENCRSVRAGLGEERAARTQLRRDRFSHRWRWGAGENTLSSPPPSRGGVQPRPVLAQIGEGSSGASGCGEPRGARGRGGGRCARLLGEAALPSETPLHVHVELNVVVQNG